MKEQFSNTKNSKLDEMMDTGFSKNKVRRSPMKRNRKDHTLSSNKKRTLHSKSKRGDDEHTRIYSKLEEDLETGSVNMMNKVEHSVKSTKTHKHPLHRKKSPFTKGRQNKIYSKHLLTKQEAASNEGPEVQSNPRTLPHPSRRGRPRRRRSSS